MPPKSPQYSFLEEYIMDVLKQNGLGKLTEENRKKYLPQLSTEAERQIGLALMPKLNEQNAVEFAKMMEKSENSPEVWQKFWRDAVPDYETVVTEVLVKFATQCADILAGK